MSEFSPQDDVPIQLRTDLNDTLIWIAEELNESFDSLAEEAISNDTLANGNSLSTSQKLRIWKVNFLGRI